jgi:hypothetical protein
MRDQLLAYLLDDLEPDQRAALENALRIDPQLAAELERMRACLAGDEAACEGEQSPPPGLVSRTCSLVERAIHCRADLAGPRSGNVSLSETRDTSVARNRWTLADLVVAAGIVLALGAMFFPALRENRDMARRLQCQEHLFRLGAALVDYDERFRQGLPTLGPGDNAGSFVITLAEKGILSREELARLVVCPESALADKVASGCVVVCIPTQAEYLAARGVTAEQLRKLMAGDYAYSLGYLGSDGRVRQIRFSRSRLVPLLADAPSFAIAGFQSANHGGCGQNVLFQDLSSRYCTQCVSPDRQDHWFLNAEGEPAAGRHAQDIVLGPSGATPILEVSGN